MNKSVIRVENLSKEYRYGIIGHGTLYKDLQSWWARIRGKEDPNSKISLHSGPARTGERFWALKDISFDVKEGEVLGIIGRNGAGKSTLLKILSRVTTPTLGYVKIRGRISSLLEVGTGFHQELTGRENVYLNGMIHGMTRAEINKKFDEIVDFSGIEKFIDTPVKRYSSGMNVRLGFAVAAHLEPEILIVDEVLAVGDAEFRRKCLEKMQDVSEGGRTVLFVSHNMQAIRELCRRGILLEGGRIVYSGPTDEVIDKYLISSSTDQNVNEDIMPRMHFYDNMEVEIYRIEMLDTDGRVINAPKVRQDFCLKIYVKFIKSGTHTITVSFWNANGTLLGLIAAPDKKHWLTGNREDIYTLTVKVNNVFLAGNHRIIVSARDKSDRIIDQVRYVSFDVLPASIKDGAAHHGIVNINSEWNPPVKLTTKYSSQS
jgi:ABC-type polysaccharide/polyol phosphate transport system ATPase subunit